MEQVVRLLRLGRLLKFLEKFQFANVMVTYCGCLCAVVSTVSPVSFLVMLACA